MSLIRFFKAGFPTQFLAMAIFGAVVWGIAATHPPELIPPNGPAPLYQLLYRLLSAWPYVAVIAGFVLVLLEAFWLNYLLIRHDLIPTNTALAGFLFLVFVSLFPATLTLTPYTITLLFVLLILQEILRSYDQKDSTVMMYIAGFYTGLASLFFVPAIFLYGFLLIAMLIFRNTGWRDWLSSLIGLTTPFLFVLTIRFLTGDAGEGGQSWAGLFRHTGLLVPEISLWEIAILSLTFLLFLAGLFAMLIRQREKTVMQRKKTIVILWLLLWAGSAWLFAGSETLHTGILLAAVLSFLVAGFYLHLRRPSRFEFLLWILILLILINTIRVSWFH